MKSLLPFLLLLVLAQVSPAAPTEAQAHALFQKFSRHLLAGDYQSAYSLRTDPYVQVIQLADGTKTKIEVSKAKALAATRMLQDSPGFDGFKKHRIKILSSETKEEALHVTAWIEVVPGTPSKAFYVLKEVGGTLRIVQEEYALPAK